MCYLWCSEAVATEEDAVEAIVSATGACPGGYVAITELDLCETTAAALELGDDTAYVFENVWDSSLRPQGCYWNADDSPNLAFNTGLWDADTDDGQRFAICLSDGVY
jgi:hypothetical protein